MGLTKRERLLLSLLGLLVAGFVFYRFALLPIQAGIAAEQAQLAQLRDQKYQVDALLADETLAEDYQQNLAQAEENYDAFYTVLNSYTVDAIINGLLGEHGLHVSKLQISPYRPVEEETTLPLENIPDQQENLLLSTVDLIASGSYSQTLAFLDALNEKSFCLQVDRAEISFGVENEYGDEARFSATIRIYGIERPDAHLT